ncbi:hypothetical protein L249_1276 [Ophiocordyceps polyrhachis-furcata BCC 54312]|uniref:Uncharacterized protein n=1 Tax=Ophiocordyceps polyrhachis-furcata BCC 54312 TaxID=1330021 RepID=A0A367LET5_9HYPO|nr:hypothetical protein L249_1276 [Ophiocordyceps polyrhachis-furcata BCC 54312]
MIGKDPLTYTYTGKVVLNSRLKIRPNYISDTPIFPPILQNIKPLTLNLLINISSDKSTVRASVKLTKPEDWTRWWNNLVNKAEEKEVWKFIDPEGTLVLTEPEEPDLPSKTRITRSGSKYKDQKKALDLLNDYIRDGALAYETSFSHARSPRDKLIQLKLKVWPGYWQERDYAEDSLNALFNRDLTKVDLIGSLPDCLLQYNLNSEHTGEHITMAFNCHHLPIGINSLYSSFLTMADPTAHQQLSQQVAELQQIVLQQRDAMLQPAQLTLELFKSRRIGPLGFGSPALLRPSDQTTIGSSPDYKRRQGYFFKKSVSEEFTQDKMSVRGVIFTINPTVKLSLLLSLLGSYHDDVISFPIRHLFIQLFIDYRYRDLHSSEFYCFTTRAFYGIEIRHSSPAHPHQNGHAERSAGTIRIPGDDVANCSSSSHPSTLSRLQAMGHQVVPQHMYIPWNQQQPTEGEIKL